MGEEELHGVGIQRVGGAHEGCHPLGIFGVIRCNAMGKEQLYNGCVGADSGILQGIGPAASAVAVRVRPGFYERGYNVDGICTHGGHQRGVAAHIPMVGVGPGLQQKAHNLFASLGCSNEQGWFIICAVTLIRVFTGS